MKYFLIIFLAVLSSCGTYIPNLDEPKNDQLFTSKVHYSIFCEAIGAIHLASKKKTELAKFSGVDNDFFEDWGLLYNVSLRTIENSAIDPTLVVGSIPPGSVVFTLNAGVRFSAQATRLETSQVFSSVKRLRSLNKCKEGDSDNILVPSGSNLGLSKWLLDQIRIVETGIISSINSREPFTYMVTFDIGKSGNVTPQWAFTNRNVSRASGLFSAARNTTHSVLFTFGPVADDRLKLEANALAVHNARLIADAISP